MEYMFHSAPFHSTPLYSVPLRSIIFHQSKHSLNDIECLNLRSNLPHWLEHKRSITNTFFNECSFAPFNEAQYKTTYISYLNTYNFSYPLSKIWL
jgi:hypothetical protein